jgi:hypothetical protein
MPIEHPPIKSSLPGCSEAVYDAIEARHTNSRYHSPFQSIKDWFPQTQFEKMHLYMQYEGTLHSIVDELAEALARPYFGYNVCRIATHPALITRAAIDWKIDHPEQAGLELVRDAIQVAMGVYGRVPEAGARLDQFFRRVSSIPQLVDAPVVQKADAATWHGSDPSMSYLTARDLAYTLEGKDVLFIPLAHGGTAAGLDVFLRYVDITQSSDSKLYLARFSRIKKGDQSPCLSAEELVYLRDVAKGKQVVIFDEDSVTHQTLNTAHAYFQGTVFRGESVCACCNLKIGSESVSQEKSITDTLISHKIENFKKDNLAFSKIISPIENNNYY